MLQTHAPACTLQSQPPLATCHSPLATRRASSPTLARHLHILLLPTVVAPAPAADHSKLITAKGQWQCCREQQSGCTVTETGEEGREVGRWGRGTQVCSAISSPHFIACLSLPVRICAALSAPVNGEPQLTPTLALFLSVSPSHCAPLSLSLSLPLSVPLSLSCHAMPAPPTPTSMGMSKGASSQHAKSVACL